MRKRSLSGAKTRVLGVVLVLLGCDPTCPRETEEVPTPFESGHTNAQRTVYETNAWDEDFVDFPAGRRLALHHGLAEVPVEFRSYVAFKARPFPEDETKPGFVAESAGNQVLLEGIDEQVIRVRNDTCEHFYLRLVATTQLATAADGAGGGANAGAGGTLDELAAGAGGG